MSVQPSDAARVDVLRVGDIELAPLCDLFARYELRVECLSIGAPIPGSYWGEAEAGLVGHVLYVRSDTPLHSALHEGCHFVCMDASRRTELNRDAGGDDLEESAVCYLQVLLADFLPPLGRQRLFADMDAWGYSFRLGSAQRWFIEDANDARQWLSHHDVITTADMPTWRARR